MKLYLFEEGSQAVQRAFVRADENATIWITYVETKSALARKFRMNELGEVALRRHQSEFERDWEHLTKIEVDRHTISRAAKLVALHPLKAYDAIHLAGATMLQQETGSAVTFACFDAALNRAASAMGLRCLAALTSCDERDLGRESRPSTLMTGEWRPLRDSNPRPQD